MAAQAQDLGNGFIKLPSGTVINPAQYVNQTVGQGQQSAPLSAADTGALNSYLQTLPPSTYAHWASPTGNITSDQYGTPLNDPSYLLAGNQQLINQTGQANNGIISGLQGTAGQYFGLENGVINQTMGLAGQSMGYANDLGNYDAGLAGLSWQNAQGANATDQQTLANYTGQLQQLSGMSLGNYGQLASSLGSIPVLSAGGYGAPVVSQAAQAYADPASIAAQNQALSQLQGFANGSHALSSQASTAQANPQDIANQEMAAGKLQGIANGSLNVVNGANDPAAFAAEHDALNQLGALTTPQNTAAEKFILEQNRLNQEQQESASRAAIMSDMRRRGMSGSGMEIGQNALAGAQTSENRLLGDLGAQAQAVNRAMVALQGYGNLSSAMNAEGNQVGEFNSNLQAQAEQAASQAYATLRAQGFSEDYARKAAADQMAQFNVGVELQGSEASGQLASNMRSQSFNEAFSRGSAADQVGEFNKSQSLIQQRFQDQYTADQMAALTGRDIAINNAGNTAIGQISHNVDTGAAAQFGVTNTDANRTQGSLGYASDLAGQVTGAKIGANGQGISALQGANQTYGGQLATLAGLGGAQISNNNNTTGATITNTGQQIGYQLGKAAADQAAYKYNNDPGGLFGTGILGKNGIFGIKGVPLF
jgi:hypothetical protein